MIDQEINLLRLRSILLDYHSLPRNVIVISLYFLYLQHSAQSNSLAIIFTCLVHRFNLLCYCIHRVCDCKLCNIQWMKDNTLSEKFMLPDGNGVPLADFGKVNTIVLSLPTTLTSIIPIPAIRIL
jgi:hypothetical protein